ncbi:MULTISPECIES: phage tail sheath subtilisin-like domain-containing protein [unclassified Streptomyces]|uniref:phage tail sheath subtilisin-like domain-containing protein n=1 Tax=unclassified Streptomyces TaxID=2593676 RepID=UPI0016616175|nr:MULTISPECIES: phage tail sheath subtilisin-like domain-containing protein [unclassified Streptomyces]MBD0706907.1 phage tail protein [Streptomyces sp. CBMA291]MBD0716998.1 phage tail protein [Streptomyces sp. CBMA370]
MPTYLSPGVYVEEVASGSRPIEGVGTSVAAFVGLAPVGPLDEPVLVTNWSQFVASFGDFTEGYYLAHSVYGFFNNGGTAAYVVRVGGGDAEGAVEAVAASATPELVAGEAVALGNFRVAALTAGTEAGGALTVEVQDVEGDTERFKLVVKDGEKVVESFDASAKKSARNYVVAQVKQRSKTIVVEEAGAGGQLAKPEAQAVTLAPPARLPEQASARGTGTALESGRFIGDSADRTGFGGLEAHDEINMVAVPDLMAAYQQGLIDLEQVKAVQLGLIAHCELMGDRMAILDPPPGLNARDIRKWRQEVAGYDSRYAALYYPWLKSFDPASGQTRAVPPSGHMAGVWARNDSERGVHKAPANEIVRGAVDLELQITRGEQDLLNPIGVNCIRAFPGRGIRVWGARTLASDPAWRYLNVRRYFNYLEESILVGTQWVVFEPNDQSLWARIRRNISAFLVNEWRQGALFGQRAEDAFYVKCDAETNPPESVDLGRVVCEIGIAPVKPAEFVVFRLAQFQGGGGELEE